MDTRPLFQAALSLSPPWEVESVSFDPQGAKGRGSLEIRLTFARGGRFPSSHASS